MLVLPNASLRLSIYLQSLIVVLSKLSEGDSTLAFLTVLLVFKESWSFSTIS